MNTSTVLGRDITPLNFILSLILHVISLSF